MSLVLVTALAIGAPVEIIDPPASIDSLAPSLAWSGSDVVATWLEPLDGAAQHRLRMARFDGQVWRGPISITQGAGVFANWADTPGIVVGYDGTMWAHWAQKSGAAKYAYDVAVARSSDGGQAWVRAASPHDDGTKTEHGFVSTVPLPGGDVVAVWLDGRHTPDAGMSLYTTMLGSSKPARVLDARVCDCCPTSVTRTRNGALVAYRDRSAKEIRDISIVRYADGRWTTPIALSKDEWMVTGCPVNGPVATTLGTEVAVAWYTEANETPTIRIAFSGDDGEKFSKPIDVATGQVLGRVQAILESPRQVLVSWLERLPGTAQAILRLRRVHPDGRLGPIHDVLPMDASRASGRPRLLRARGALLIMWTEPKVGVRMARLPLAAIPRLPQKRRPRAKARPPLAVGDPFPRLELEDLDGRTMKVEPGTLYVRWATWCRPCREEMPLLRRLAAQGRKIVGINIDPEGQDEAVRGFLRQYGIRFANLRDPSDRSGRALGQTTIPTAHLVDAEGRIGWQITGVVTEEGLIAGEK